MKGVHDETVELLKPTDPYHVSRGEVPQERIGSLEPKNGLVLVSKVLPNEGQSDSPFSNTLLQLPRHLLVISDGLDGNLGRFRNILFLKIQQFHDSLVVSVPGWKQE